MRKKIVAGNWKMNKNAQDARALWNELKVQANNLGDNVEVIVAPPALYLSEMAMEGPSKIKLSAQNCATETSGAYTGEISAEMLASAGVGFCILGHSERRAYYGETDELVAKKIEQCFANGVIPIYCCGEVKEDREAGSQNQVVKQQVEQALFALSKDQIDQVIIAYEPVWAIGTGLTASADQAQEMHAFIRSLIAEKYGQDKAENIRILYGGSAKPSNAPELFSQPDVDGGLIGGAALKAEDFFGIINAANR